jgi:hypothetical protein
LKLCCQRHAANANANFRLRLTAFVNNTAGQGPAVNLNQALSRGKTLRRRQPTVPLKLIIHRPRITARAAAGLHSQQC